MMNQPGLELPGNESPVFLRALERSDLAQTIQWHNDQDLYRDLIGTFRLVSERAAAAWLDERITFSRHEVNLAVCLGPAGDHIGNAYLRPIDWTARHAELHIFIGEVAQRGRGYGMAAMRLLIAHAFDDLGLLRLYLFVLARNQAAIRLYEKCGFVMEGRLRRHAFKDGTFEDVLVMGLCREATG